MSLYSDKIYKQQDSLFPMAEITNENLASRLDFVQQSVWKIEDYTIKTLGTAEKNESVLYELKFCLNLLNEKIDKIESEIRGLRSNGAD